MKGKGKLEAIKVSLFFPHLTYSSVTVLLKLARIYKNHKKVISAEKLTMLVPIQPSPETLPLIPLPK
jgi:hypothetical protein